jgi:hypothetical protein
MMGFLVTIQKRFDINIICIAHPHSVAGPSGISSVSRIVAKGHKAPQTVLNSFNEVYHMDRVFDSINAGATPKRVMYTQGGSFSRTAWPFLPPIIDFTDRAFYEVLRSHLDNHYLGGSKNDVANKQPQSL